MKFYATQLYFYPKLWLRYPKNHNFLLYSVLRAPDMNEWKKVKNLPSTINLNLYLELCLRYSKNNKLIGIQLIQWTRFKLFTEIWKFSVGLISDTRIYL